MLSNTVLPEDAILDSLTFSVATTVLEVELLGYSHHQAMILVFGFIAGNFAGSGVSLEEVRDLLVKQAVKNN